MSVDTFPAAFVGLTQADQSKMQQYLACANEADAYTQYKHLEDGSFRTARENLMIRPNGTVFLRRSTKR